MIHNNFSLKPTVFVLIFIAILFVVVVGINYFFTSEMLVEKAQMDSKNDARLLISRIQSEMNPVETAVLGVKTNYSWENISTRTVKKYLKTLTDDNDQIISAHGIYFNPTSEFTGENYSVITYSAAARSGSVTESDNTFINNVVKTGLDQTGLFWSEPFLHPDAGEMAIACMTPANFILPDSMLTRGFILATLRLKWLEKLVSSGDIFSSSAILVLSKDGKPVVSSGNDYNYKDDIFTIAKTTQNAEFIELGSKMKSGKSGFMQMKNFGFKGASYVSFQPIPQTGWSVAAGIAKSELYYGLYFTSILLIIAGFVVLVLVVWLQIFNTGRIVKPIKVLTEAIKEIGSGNTHVSFPEIKSPKVLAELAGSLAAMQVDFKHQVNNPVRKPKESETQVIPGNVPVNKFRSNLFRNDFETFSANRNFDMAAIFNMADGGNGNFYDYFMVNNHTLCFCIGDATGKGLPATLFITKAITFFRTGNYFGESLSKVITGMNHQLSEQNTDSLSATFFVGILNFENYELIFCNASHPFPYLIKGGDLFEVHGTHGPALTEQPDHIYKTGKLKLDQGDKLVLFTYGIMEANNDQGDIFGKDWFEDVLRDSSNLPSGQMTAFIKKELNSFAGKTRQQKDITVIVLQAGMTQIGEA